MNGVQRPGAAADGALAPRRRPDHEAGLVDEVHDRQVELVAQVDEARELVGGRGAEPAAVMRGVGSEHPHRASVEPGQRGDQRAAEAAPSSRIEPRSRTSSRTARIL